MYSSTGFIGVVAPDRSGFGIEVFWAHLLKARFNRRIEKSRSKSCLYLLA